MNVFYKSMLGNSPILRAAVLIIAICADSCGALANTAQNDDMIINLDKDGDTVTLDLTVTVQATPQEAWAVLTDYDHMPLFLSNLQSSKILEKNGDRWKVEQKGSTRLGGFSFSFESVREVDLKPFESIRSRVVSGTLKKHDGYTQIFQDGIGTRIVYHSITVPNIWVPAMLINVIFKEQIRRQFQEMRAEILKRKRIGGAGD